MYEVGAYNVADRMSDLICENYPMLLVMSRFGIELGFGEKSIGEVCQDSGVDSDTFLAVVNLLISDDKKEIIMDDIHLSVSSLVLYLRNSHAYFLDFKLPSIRCKLIEAIDSDNELSVLIIRYYDEYVNEVRKHMMYEEQTVFPYVESLLVADADGTQAKYSIDVFSKQHSKVETKLSELKDIIIKYYPARSSNELSGVLFDIFSCAQDMISHTEVEDYIFTPAVREFELQKNRD